MNIDKNKIIEYLKKTGLNPNIITFVQEKYIGIGQMKSIIEETIQDSIELEKNEIDENVINQLLRGNENFCITSEGNLWIKEQKNQQDIRKPDVVRIAGQTLGMPNLGRDTTIASTNNYIYIESKNNEIRERRVSINRHENKGEQYYSGKISEDIYNLGIERLKDKSAQWGKEEEKSIPNKELVTSINIYSNFLGQSFVDKIESSMENFNEWNWLTEKPTTIVEKNFQKDIMEETEKRRITISRVGEFFRRFRHQKHEVDRMNRE